MTLSFADMFRGPLRGIRSEEEYESLAKSLTGMWSAIKFAGGENGILAVDGAKAGDMMIALRDEIKLKKLLSGAIPYTYVHTPDSPKMIKLYDPLKCGSSCSAGSPEPWWIFSTVEPEEGELETIKKALMAPQPEKAFFKNKFFS